MEYNQLVMRSSKKPNTRASTLRKFWENPLILPIYLPTFFFALALGLLTPVLPLYAGGLSDSYGLIGLVVSGAGLGTLLADLPSGLILRKVGKKLATLIGIGLCALSTGALFWVNSIFLALGLRILAGMGMSLYSIARHVYITGAAATESRGRAIALFGGVFRLGVFIGPVLGGIISSRINFRLPFLVFLIFCGVAMLIVLIARHHFIEEEEGLIDTDTSQGSLMWSEIRPRLGVLSISGFGHILSQITRAGQRLIIPLFCADVLGLDIEAIGYIVAASSAVSMTLFYPVGLIMDRVGRKWAIVPSFVIQGLGLALLPLTHGFNGAVLVSALIGFGHGFGSGTMMTLGADLSPQVGRSTFLALWRWVGDAGLSGGPLVVGYVADILTLPSASLAVAGAGIMAGLIFAFFVPETLKKVKD